MKVRIERFGYNNLLYDFEVMKSVVKIAMVVWWNSIKHPSQFYILQILNYFVFFNFSS